MAQVELLIINPNGNAGELVHDNIEAPLSLNVEGVMDIVVPTTPFFPVELA